MQEAAVSALEARHAALQREYDQDPSAAVANQKIATGRCREIVRALPVSITAIQAYPEQLTPALAEVLGMPPYRLHPIWMSLREVGQDVRTRYEDEVAAALHFLIPIAIEHGENWQPAAAQRLRELQAAHLASTGAE